MGKLDTLGTAAKQAQAFLESVEWSSFFAEAAFEFKPKIKSPDGYDVYIGDAAYKTIKPMIL